MTCKNCKNKPVIKLPNSNVSLCKNHFNRYIEKKVRKTIREYKLIDKKDIVATAVSGGKDSLSLIVLIDKLLKQRKIKHFGIIIDEGARPDDIKLTEKICKKHKIPLKKISFKKEYNFTLFDIAEKLKGVPCASCAVLRRQLLNKKARELKATKLVTGHNLDDEAQSILMNQFKANPALSARLGPLTGVKQDKRFVRRVKPFYFISEHETEIYAKANNIVPKRKICPFRCGAFRKSVMVWLDKFDKKYPGTKQAIVKSYIKVMPILKTYKQNKIKTCKVCKEPCSQPDSVCQACKIIKEINLNKAKSK